MAENIFAKSPVEIATQKADARMRSIFDTVQAPPSPQAPSGQANFDTLARQYQVPANVIAAIAEAAGIEDQGKAGMFAGRVAETIGSHIAGGMGMKDAVKATFPEGIDTDALLTRAVAMADGSGEAKDPDTAPAEGGRGITDIASDFGRRAVSSVVSGSAAALEGLGRGLDRTVGADLQVEEDADGNLTVNAQRGEEPSAMVDNARATANTMRDYSKGVAAGISEEAKGAMNGSTFKGDIFKPSTWEMPDDPSVEGLAHLTVEVLGSMTPVIIASLMTRNPLVGAGVGGSQSAGAGAEQAREIIQEAAQDMDEDGVSRLERESPYYQNLIEDGKSPDDAVRLTSEAAEKSAAGWAAIPGALGGAATGRILQKPLQSLATRGIATRVGGTAAVSAAEEGTQEVAETIAGRAGLEEATGLDVDLTEDTLNDFVLGAMGGGPVGAIGGIRGDSNARNAGRLADALDAAEAPPAGESPYQDAASTVYVDAKGNETAPPERAPAPEPTGPIGRAAEFAPEMQEAPAPMATSGMVKRSKVRLDVPGGVPIEAVFKEETDEGMTFEQEGNPFFITREEIEAGAVAVVQINPLAEAQVEVAQPQATAIPDQPIQSEVVPANMLDNDTLDGDFIPEFTAEPVSQVEVDARIEIDENGLETVTPEMAVAERIVPPPSEMDDFMLGADRTEAIWSHIRDTETDLGVELAGQERQRIFESINDNGGSVEDAVWSQLEREPTEYGYTEQQDVQHPGPPILEPELPGEGGRPGAEPISEGTGRSEGTPGSEEPGGTRPDDVVGAGSPAPAVDTQPEAPQMQDQWWRSLPKTRHAVKQLGYSKEELADVWADKDKLVATVNDRLNEQGFGDIAAPTLDDVQAVVDELTNGTTEPANEPKPTEKKPEAQDNVAGMGAAQTTGPDYPNRKLSMRYAASDENGQPAMDDTPFGNIALANMHEGDEIRGIGTVLKVTEKQIHIKDAETGKTKRFSIDTPRFEQLVRDVGGLVSASQHGADTGNVLDAIKRDPAFSYDGNQIPRLSESATETKDGPTDPIIKDLAPTKQEFDAAASEADPNPTEAQAKVGNYKKGHIAWNGLDLAIETAKGEERTGTGPDGTAWSVTMPAHYGDFKRTEGADGDPVDFYMGDMPDSDHVVIVNQIDSETGKFDEHKIVLGTADEAASLLIYEAGFSDGSGKARNGSHTATDVAGLKAWLADGDTTKPVKDQEPEVKKVQEPQEVDAPVSKLDQETEDSARIEDFGEVLTGAQKHKAQEWAKRVADVSDSEVATVPLSKSWPEPKYQELIDAGIDPAVVAFIHAARDEIPTKPRGRYSRAKTARWVAQVTTLRQFSIDLASGKYDMAEVRAKATGALEGFTGRADLYEKYGHEKSLKGISLRESQYSMREGVRFDPPKNLWVVSEGTNGSWPKEHSVADTRQEAIDGFRPAHAAMGGAKAKRGTGVKFEMRQWKKDKRIFIGKKVGNEWVEVATDLDWDWAAARAYLAENQEALEEKFAKLKTLPPERGDENAPRIGVDHRNGQDVTSEMFAEAFGFRGVQFGNYVEGPRRQADMNRAYDSLMDLAGIIGIPPKAISLNGSLGLAFGARGSGKRAAAHFEPDSVVINLTKAQGAGSLAHEWWHALDNYFSRQGNIKTGYITESGGRLGDVRTKARAAFEKTAVLIRGGALKLRSQQADKRKSKPYFSEMREMSARSFESYVIAKLQDQGASNDYLANILSEEAWNAIENMNGQAEQSWPYVRGTEMPDFREAFDKLFDTIQTEETESGVRMFMVSKGQSGVVTDRARNVIRKILRNEKVDTPVVLANTPEVLIALGVKDTPMVISQSDIWKSVDKHGMTEAQVVEALDGLADPVMVFDSATAKGGLVALVEVKGEPRPVVVAVHPGTKVGFIEITRIASVHRKNNAGQIKQWLEKGLLRYRDKRATANWSLSRGLQLPKESANRRSGNKVLSHADVFKADAGDRAKLQNENDANGKPRSEVGKLTRALNEELKRFGLDGKVTAKAWREMKVGPLSLDGLYFSGVIGVSASATDSARNVLRHEIIHALRDTSFWGGENGLFTKAEWRSLVAEARKRKDLMAKAKEDYSDRPISEQVEEVIAELFREWGVKRDATTPLGKLFQRISGALKALANALHRQGQTDAASVFDRIERGEVGRRGDDSPDTTPPRGAKHKRSRKPADFTNAPHVNAGSLKVGASELVSNVLTQAMAGKGGANLMALVPGRALMSELGSKMPAVRTYMRLKEKMDTLRNHFHSETDVLAQKWRKLLNSDKDANARLMDLMHDSTIEGQDPSKVFMPISEPRDAGLVERYGVNSKTGAEALKRIKAERKRRKAYDDLRGRFMKLPAGFRDMYVDVRDSYTNLASEFETAIEENAGKAMNVSVRRAERAHARKLEEIRDDGLTGRDKANAIAEADAVLKTAKMQNQWAKTARLQTLRMRFESNRLQGPYFPLKRFGDFYVTLRDEDGKVISFSRFEKVGAQRRYAKEQKAAGLDVETGVMKEISARDSVDPGFVADIEDLMGEIDADTQVMDAIWQRWLETLPDMSQRKSRLHRKGTPGYAPDAFRAFAYNMFHGSHQLARLKYSLDMGEALDVAEEEARHSDSPERNGLIVKEVSRRNDFVMNPKGSAWAQVMTSAAFVYYLGWTPAAALVNITQTSVVGIPILGAYFGKGGNTRAAKELSQALVDFTRGKGEAANSKNITIDEKKAMESAYERGTVDKSQAHDLAGVGETGVEYSDQRTKVMAVVSFAFHHAERLNREVTFLAAYRMAKAKGGLSFDEAVEKAADLTWKTHFDYQNSSRPRLMQNDFTRVALVFRNFQINMLWRLFRDTHQSLSGETAEAKTEARRQLVGISAQMLLHAGIKGVWGYSIIKALVGMFFPGGGDDAEKEMEKALMAFLPRDVVGAMLNGVPGHLLGIDLRSRVGMPDLWFRSPDRQLEGEDEYNFWMQQMIGAVPGMAQNIHRGIQQIGEGNVYRGVETIVPKAIRDMLRSGRYAADGAQTYSGDPIVEHFKPHELIAQFLGFTPARLSERYDANTRLKNEEKRIKDQRRSIMAAAGKSALNGGGIPDSVIEKIGRFNEANPDYPITTKSLRQSIKGRANASARNEFGAQLNPRLNQRLRDDAAPLIYGN